MKLTIIIVIVALTIIFPVRWMIRIDRVYDYLERKTMWCYSQNGVMIEVHCFSHDMNLIEVPPNIII